MGAEESVERRAGKLNHGPVHRRKKTQADGLREYECIREVIEIGRDERRGAFFCANGVADITGGDGVVASTVGREVWVDTRVGNTGEVCRCDGKKLDKSEHIV